MTSQDIVIPINERNNRRQAMMADVGAGFVAIVLTYGIISVTTQIGNSMAVSAAPDRLISAAAIGLFILLWVASVAAIIAIAVRRHRNLRKFTGSIVITETFLNIGTLSVPQKAIETIQQRGRYLRIAYMADGKKCSVNIPISWLTPEAVTRLNSL
jgi:hypothetical protein